MKRLILFLLSTYLIASISPALFSEEEDENVHVLSDFVVSESDDKGYYSANTTSVTKANELIKNTPVNVTVINEDLLRDLGINTTEDLAQVSASIDTDPTSYSLDQIRIRGFRNTFTRFNGFRRTLARDGYNISRYDIIKGANSLIFGQASPGGTVNAIPLIANFRKDSGALVLALGNKNYEKKVFNYNKILSDNLAARYMHVDHYQEYEHAYKNYDLESKTISINFRPDSTSSLLGHFEKVDSKFSFPTLALRDDTKVDDSVVALGTNRYGSQQDDGTNATNSWAYDGYLSSAEHRIMRQDFQVPFTSEWLSFAPQALIDNLISHTQYNLDPNGLTGDPNLDALNNQFNQSYGPNSGIVNTNPNEPFLPIFPAESDEFVGGGRKITGAEFLKNYYKLINESNYGYQSGPDKSKTVSGYFSTLDYQKVLNNNLELSLSLNYQEQKGENFARDSHGISRVVDSFSVHNKNWPKPQEHLFYTVNENGVDEQGGSFSPVTNISFDPNTFQVTGERDSDAIDDYIDWHTQFYPEPFIRTYWTKTNGESERLGAKATLLYEKNLNIPVIGKSENKFLLGIDYHDLNKDEKRYDQIPDYTSNPEDPMNPLNPDGSYLGPYESDLRTRSEWVTSNSITDRERAFDYISLRKGFGPERSIIRLNNKIETDFIILDENGDFIETVKTGYIRTGLENLEDSKKPNTEAANYNSVLFNDGEGERIVSAKWTESAKLSANIETNSQWLASQSSFFKGRLRTLLGLRYDEIEVESTNRKTSLFGDGSSNLTYKDENGNTQSFGIDDINQKDQNKYTEYSPSVGGLFWLKNNFGIFANYAESIQTPSGQDRTPLGTLVAPEIGKGLEIGFRYSSNDNKIDAQLAYYSIEKENDDEFKYSNVQLNQIYDFDVYKFKRPYIYRINTDSEGNVLGGTLNSSTLPGRRSDGDVTLSKGVELDVNYNPNKNITFITSINHNIGNKILKVHPKVQDWLDENNYNINDQFELYGRPSIRASVTGKYSFRGGKLRGLSFGIAQHFRSSSKLGKYSFHYGTESFTDQNGNGVYDQGEAFDDLNNNTSWDNEFLWNKNSLVNQPNINHDPNSDNPLHQRNENVLDAHEQNMISKTSTHYLESDPEHNTIGFISYTGKFDKKDKKIPYSINFRINNLFDKRQFINRGTYGYFRESRSYNISAKIMF